jgi:hypothetical protein
VVVERSIWSREVDKLFPPDTVDTFVMLSS